MSGRIEPMLCQSSDETTLDGITVDGNLAFLWVCEEKFDGMRVIANAGYNGIRLWSRRGNDVTKQFPEIVGALGKVGTDTVLDGEITVTDPSTFKTDFELLLRRMTDDPLRIKIMSQKFPAIYRVFDILRFDGDSMLDQRLGARKRRLDISATDFDHMRVQVVSSFYGIGRHRELYDRYIKEGSEGIILKNLDSVYRPGVRSPNWLKVKRSDTVDVYVVGATMSDAGLPFAALVLATMEKDGLKYYGKVGTGFTDAKRLGILRYLEKRKAKRSLLEILPDLRTKSVCDDDSMILTCEATPAEVRIQETYSNGSPRFPVWVRFKVE